MHNKAAIESILKAPKGIKFHVQTKEGLKLMGREDALKHYGHKPLTAAITTAVVEAAQKMKAALRGKKKT